MARGVIGEHLGDDGDNHRMETTGTVESSRSSFKGLTNSLEFDARNPTESVPFDRNGEIFGRALSERSANRGPDARLHVAPAFKALSRFPGPCPNPSRNSHCGTSQHQPTQSIQPITTCTDPPCRRHRKPWYRNRQYSLGSSYFPKRHRNHSSKRVSQVSNIQRRPLRRGPLSRRPSQCSKPAAPSPSTTSSSIPEHSPSAPTPSSITT